MELLRVGLVGGGPWARAVHGPALAAHPGVDLAAVWTRRAEAGRELASALGAPAHETFDGLLDAVDAVAFAVPPDVQGGLVIRAAAAGKHVICEKPLAGTSAAAQTAAEAIGRAGVVSSMVLILRFDPAVRAWLGSIPAGPAAVDTVGSARWLSGALLGGPYATSSWRAEHGALLDIGPHLIDLMDAALGPVTGVAWAERDEPDLWRFGLDHSGGAQSTVITSLRIPVDPSEIEFTVVGSAGSHRLAQKVSDAPNCYARLLDEFVAAVSGTGPAPALDAARGLRLQEIVDEVGRSAGQVGRRF